MDNFRNGVVEKFYRTRGDLDLAFTKLFTIYPK